MKYYIFFLLFFFINQTGIAQYHVPVLCYHNIYPDNKRAGNSMFISRDQLDAQLKSLTDSGYHTILPDQLLEYLAKGVAVPPRTVMITFDDTRLEHFTMGAPLLRKYGFKGVFFAMTVPIGKPGYMDSRQLKALSDEGHVIAAHTWDHPYLKNLQEKDWKKQLDNPKQELQKITGKPVMYFAYPFGQWNASIISGLEAHGYKAAFQLKGKSCPGKELYTIRRIMVDGHWSGSRLQQEMKDSF